MLTRLNYLLLPIAGAVSALLSFMIAAPYVGTLNRPNLSPDDPVAHFTFGTLWTNVQHSAFGALLCGSFCFLLTVGRRTPVKVLISTVVGAVLGGIANGCADSGADLVGINAMRHAGHVGHYAGEIAWFIFVPLALSFSIMFSLGMTKARFARAILATAIAAVLTAIGRTIGSVIGGVMLLSKLQNMSDIKALESNMQASIPMWTAEATAAGIALGLTMYIADHVSRRGSIRLIYGRNEYKDWSLDYQANRIGSGEVEIPVRGFKGVEAVHSCIFRQGNQFIFDSQHFPATVNGYPAQQAALSPGDTIQIGEATLVFYGSGAVRGNYRPASQRPYEPAYGQPAQGYNPLGLQPHPMPPQGAYPQTPPMNPIQPQAAPVAPAPVMAAPRFVLIDLGGKEILLQPGPNTVGREVGNAICLPTNSTVSRQHAVIEVNGDKVTVADVGSANGTCVNRLPITSITPLNGGEEISFGSAVFAFRSS